MTLVTGSQITVFRVMLAVPPRTSMRVVLKAIVHVAFVRPQAPLRPMMYRLMSNVSPTCSHHFSNTVDVGITLQ